MADPRDHILVLAAQLRSDMTTLANVTAKVRVNNGAATTYTNVSSPAITQYADSASGYELKIPANTYADGDTLQVTWLYSGTDYAIEPHVIGPAAVDGAHYTNTRGDTLANLDVAVSTRSTYAGADTSGTTTLLSRLTSGRASNLDNLDAAVSSRSTVAAIWAAVVDSSGVTTLLSRLTAGRAAKLDLIGTAVNISAPVSPTSGDVVVYQGDDYKAADSRSLVWTDSAAVWPSITGATISFQLRDGGLTKAGSVVSATSARVELTRSDIASLTPGVTTYALIATLTNSDVVTLATGRFLLETRP